MRNLTPKYQKILDAAIGIDRQQFEQLQQQVELFDRNQRIHDQFHNRNGKTMEEVRWELSEKYNMSESNVERIAYDLFT